MSYFLSLHVCLFLRYAATNNCGKKLRTLYALLVVSPSHFSSFFLYFLSSLALLVSTLPPVRGFEDVLDVALFQFVYAIGLNNLQNSQP